MDRNPRILRNRGIEIPLGVLNGDGRSVEADGDGEPTTEHVWLRFTVAAIAELEDRYGGKFVDVPVLDEETGAVTVDEATGKPVTRRLPRDLSDILNEELSARPNAMAMELVALGTGLDRETAGLRLLPERINEYNAAIGVAYALAMGVDPNAAGKAFRKTVAAADVVRDAMQSALEEWGQPESPGTTGTPDGPAPDEASPSSGA